MKKDKQFFKIAWLVLIALGILAILLDFYGYIQDNAATFPNFVRSFSTGGTLIAVGLIMYSKQSKLK